ncbi:Peptidyl-prolyl cis-trans isomerase [Nitrospira sp. KM1]|uniref:FKBP-type peptidyl-prolyl cis-trans isomerase n=1 Tax=Nitrospira sp. KM1 TaxID=1936990 RepID=UPI0013A75E21|nr:peptidylprolyl isomerase [Nitrospira sp. KM1]BCA53204.1 Peptidyl-prolyl cis-trans isomerase [Nitrospira sp. KM1]
MRQLRLATQASTVAILCLCIVGAQAMPDLSLASSQSAVQDGAQVSLEYTLSLDDHTILESNVGKELVTYRQGGHEIVPGLEKGLLGAKPGDKRHVVVAPVDGYGEVDTKAIQTVNASLVPEEARKVGAQLEAKGPDGQSAFPRVTAVSGDTVTLDFNHPLAGKTLIFDVTVVNVTPAAP